MATIFGSYEPGDFIPPYGALPTLNSDLIPLLKIHQQFRFVVEIMNIPVALIESVSLPSYKIETQKQRLLTHEIIFPKSVSWNPISFTFIEIYEPQAFSNFKKDKSIMTEHFYNYLLSAGYPAPNKFSEISQNMSKDSLSSQINMLSGEIVIRNLKPSGEDAFAWKIVNPIITSVNFGNNEYTEGLMKIKVDIDYDWAYFSLNGKF